MAGRSRGVSVRRPEDVVHLPGVPAGSMPPEWPGALCAQSDPDAWFPEKGGPVRRPKQICRACPHRAECLEWALEANEGFGIWGGLTALERRKLLAERAASSGVSEAPAPGGPVGDTARTSAYPVRPRPVCHPDAELVGGPVVLWCSGCGRGVHAGVLDVEFGERREVA